MPAHPVGGVTMPAAAPLSHGEILATMAEEMDACAIAASEFNPTKNGLAEMPAIDANDAVRRNCRRL